MPNYRLNKTDHVDETNRISFKFDGKTYSGFKGDTLASALLSNGIHLVGRSFKYHRPRGIMSCGTEEPNAICQINGNSNLTEPNVRATEIELYEGLEANSQNCWPNVNFDIGGINNLISPFIPAGFYYKTFMWPKSFWKNVYEPLIRKSAGLGKSPTLPDPEIYDHKHVHCDVLVIGGGISGIISAKLSAKNNLNTILVDDKNTLGGSTIYQNNENFKVDNEISKNWLEKEINELNKLKNLTIKTRTSVAAYHSYNYLLAKEILTDHLPLDKKNDGIRQRLWKIRAKKVIIATGAIERPLVFNNNDRPGILLANSVNKYLNFYGVACGENNFIFTNNDSAYETAVSLFEKNISVNIIDIRKKANSDIVKQAEKLGIKIYWNSCVTNTFGYRKINSVEIMQLSDDGLNVVRNKSKINCDCLAVSGGWTPVVHMHTQSGGKLNFRENDQVFLPKEYNLNQISVGSCKGDFELDDIIKNTNNEIKNYLDIKESDFDDTRVTCSKELEKRNIWLLPNHISLSKTKSFIDFQNDSTSKDIKLALREGFRSIEHVKRYTTTGMATDQGKLSNMHALGIIAETAGVKIGSLGTTTFRPPFTPLTFGVIVGRNVGRFFDITRKTPIHEWHVENKAEFENVGQWKRPWYYPKNNEDIHQAVQRESKAARDSAGILDASTLGKIDIQGTDASEFLNRIYTNAWSKLEIGRCRYGLMLNEDGMVYDDGVTTRLGENHYLMTTTTGGAANVLSKLEDYLQTEWPELDVYLTSVTDHYATASVCGPNSKKILMKLFPNIKFDDENFPHMSLQNAKISNANCRIMRISFTGEHSYEINIEAKYGKSLWEKCIETGKKFNITPYGTETMHLLRAEKGFIIVGQDTDGTMTPIDLQMDWIVSKNKYDFIGKRSLYRSDTIRDDRKQLVGLLTDDPKEVLEEGAQIVADVKQKPIEMLGHVTSSYYSPNLNKSIALAVVRSGKEMKGTKLVVPMENKNINVTVSDFIFLDKENKRLNA
ncbi:sarcosine oxidase subunit alpha family protein [Candidatus Pelagibacter sp.]|nr:sarcosine oxidase subunit alpha family protein [Candidatus Pelagibacter sp.]